MKSWLETRSAVGKAFSFSLCSVWSGVIMQADEALEKEFSFHLSGVCPSDLFEAVVLAKWLTILSGMEVFDRSPVVFGRRHLVRAQRHRRELSRASLG